MANLRHSQLLVRVASAIAFGVGCLTLIGWIFDIAIFKSAILGTATMKANTAVAFILAGVSLFVCNGRGTQLCAPTRITTPDSLIAKICAAVALIGLLTLCQYIFNWKLGIDELLVRDLPLSPANPYPGRMADNTALNFVLLGGALWLLAVRFPQPPLQRGASQSSVPGETNPPVRSPQPPLQRGASHHGETNPPLQSPLSRETNPPFPPPFLRGAGGDRIFLAQALSLAVILIALLALIGYAYGVEVFYRFIVYSTSMSWHTAIIFLLLGAGTLLVDLDRGFMAVVTSELNGGIVARRLIPSAIAIPIILGWLILQGYRWKLYDPGFAIALLVLLLIAVYISVIWHNARSLNRIDRDRQRTIATLQESEAKFRRLVESNIIGIYFGDFSGRIFEANDAFLSMMGYTRTELEAGKLYWNRMTPPEYEALDRQRVAEIQAYGACSPFEKEYIRKDGIRVPILLGITQIEGGENGYSACFVIDLTERKQAEIALCESEERFRRAVVNAPFPIVIHAEDGEVVHISQAWTELSGYTADEIPTIAAWAEKAYGAAKNTVKASIERLYSIDRRLEEGEFSITTKQGEKRTWDFSSAPLGRLADGRRLVISMAADVSDRKLTENALRQSEARLRLFVESDVIGILYGDIHGGINYANDAFLHIIGYTRADLEAGRVRWNDLTPPEYLPLDAERIAEARTKGTCTPYEKEYIRQDGTRVFVMLGYALLGENREQSVAFVLDISDRKHAEIERDRFFTLSLDMLCIAGLDGYFKRINPAFETILGFTQKEILQTPYIDLIHPEDREKSLAEVEKLSTGAITINFENRFLCKNGSYKWLIWSSVPDVESKLLYAVGHDVTERKHLEHKLRKQAEVLHKLNATLEERVRQRTAQLEAANQELESFSYSVSHDLRAPLRHIAGFVDLLQKRIKSNTTLDETSQRYLNIIVDTTQLAGKLIDDLLSFSRMGRMEMRFTNIDMNLLVQEVLQELELETKKRQISWQIKALLSVQGDPAMLRLVWRNLIENALKYTKLNSQTEITIGSQILSESQEVVFFVRDNGIGFDMQYVNKLFGVFQRLHSDPNFQGTGVGLANVQRIIHRHGGRVWAEGEIDKGATFFFSLPRLGVRGGE
jgi:PAS domain S-box-containing protein